MALIRHKEYPSKEQTPDFCSRLNWLVRHLPDETDLMHAQGLITKSKLTRMRRGTVAELHFSDVAILASAYGVSIEWLVYGIGDPLFDWVDEKGLPVDVTEGIIRPTTAQAKNTNIRSIKSA